MNETNVIAFLNRGRQLGSHISALDAVMGEDWARLKLGNPMRVLQMSHLVRQQTNRVKHKRSITMDVIQRRPQAMVKMVGRGGTKDAKGLRDQMKYLSREGNVPLLRSERYFGVEMDADELSNIERAWNLEKTRGSGADRTSHFVVSFPEGTDRDAAERAGRAWAEEMFESGRFGDQWDYYTSNHRDTAYPHIHVVVSRRGLEAGDWLKVSRRGELTFDVMRDIQVEVAAREGIRLEASPRLARGVHDRPVPDAEYRRAKEQGRAPVPPVHSDISAAAAAATVLQFARQYEADAAFIQDRFPETAQKMKKASADLKCGQALTDEHDDVMILNDSEEIQMAETITAKKDKVLSGLREMDEELAEIKDPRDRVRIQRQMAELKADAARWMPEREELQDYQREIEGQGYGGVREEFSNDARAAAIANEADERVMVLASDAGVDPDVTIERYRQGRASVGLMNDYLRDELADLEAGQSMLDPQTHDENLKTLEALRANVAEVYQDVDRRLGELGYESEAERLAAVAEGEERHAEEANKTEADFQDRYMRERKRLEERLKSERDQRAGRDRDDDDGLTF